MPRRLFAAVLAIGLAAPLAAQDFVGSNNVVASGIANTAAMNSVLRNTYGQSGGSVRRIARPAPMFAPRGGGNEIPASNASFAYTASPAVAREALDGYIKRASRTEPEGARQLAEQLGRHDYRKIYRGLIAGTGLRENDAVDALTAYTVLGWLIVHNVSGAPDARGVQALRAQLAARSEGNPNFAPGRRAALGEEFKLLFVTLHSGWQSARREGDARRYGDGVAELFRRQADLDLKGLRLTREGFAAR